MDLPRVDLDEPPTLPLLSMARHTNAAQADELGHQLPGLMALRRERDMITNRDCWQPALCLPVNLSFTTPCRFNRRTGVQYDPLLLDGQVSSLLLQPILIRVRREPHQAHSATLQVKSQCGPRCKSRLGTICL